MAEESLWCSWAASFLSACRRYFLCDGSTGLGGPRVFQWCSTHLVCRALRGVRARWIWNWPRRLARHVPKKLTCGRTVASEAMGQETAEDQEEEQGKERKVMVATRMEKARVPLRQRSIATVGIGVVVVGGGGRRKVQSQGRDVLVDEPSKPEGKVSEEQTKQGKQVKVLDDQDTPGDEHDKDT